ncbi:hypothetical protein F4809DRAFT_631623 [Biscogniauxia mediterranea]|nr:hypothetical protein F4809DRAFT_631623 [Biscogniauxia mediterranea]
MSKRSNFTTISPLPAGISREFVINFLHNHQEMIDLNPLIIERHPIPPPAHAPAEEQRCVWWSMTDRISYLPGGAMSGEVTYTAAFNDLPNGIQTHSYAPMGTDIRGRWSLNGTLPGEPLEPVELGLGAPRQGLYLREDVELRCNFMMSAFVKKTLKKAHGTLVDRLCEKAKIACSRNPSISVDGTPIHRSPAPSCSSSSVHSGSDKDTSAVVPVADDRTPLGSRLADSSYPNTIYPFTKVPERPISQISGARLLHKQQQHQRHFSDSRGTLGPTHPALTRARGTSTSYSMGSDSHGWAPRTAEPDLVPEPLRLGHMRTGSGTHYMHPNQSSSSGAPQIPPLSELDHGLQPQERLTDLGVRTQNGGWPGGSGRPRAHDGAVYDPHVPGRRQGGAYPAELE